MSKKLGAILAFVGGYTTMIGGLVWVMHFNTPERQALYKPYDWAWGLICAIVIVIGTFLSLKGYILGIVGLVVELGGIIGAIVTLMYGITQENYLSALVLVGIILATLGFVNTTVFHIIEMIKIKNHGYSMLK